MPPIPSRLHQLLIVVISFFSLPQVAAADPFSSLHGQLAVNGRGAAVYSVPLDIPVGLGGLTPSLSLTYNSQNRAGLAGVGWTLSGLPAITICQPTVAQDGKGGAVSVLRAKPGKIQFCLDGERLIPIVGAAGASGTEYRTERDQFLRIKSMATDPDGSYGGEAPLSFDVQTRDGLTMKFGEDLYSYGYGHTRRKWSLNRVTDQNNNYYKITYLKSTGKALEDLPYSDGVQYPSRIDYSGNVANLDGTKRSIVFSYTSKSMAPLALEYEGGFPIRDDKYLSSIEILAGTQSISGYLLRYTGDNPGQGSTPVHLSSIERCMNSSYSNCLPRLTLGWMQDGTSPTIFQTPNGAGAFPGKRADYRHYFVDVAGTGKKWWVQISAGADETWVGSAKPDGTFSADCWQLITTPMGKADDFDFRFADVNGDGKADWIRIEKATGNASIALGRGDGTFDFWTNTVSSMGSSTTYQHEFGDVNGDGRADWIRITRATGDLNVAQALPSGALGPLAYAGSVNAPYSPVDFRVLDMNADGLTDIASIGKSAPSYEFLATADGTGNLTTMSGLNVSDVPPVQVLVDDVNGDGIPDIVEVFDSSPPTIKITFGKGDGWLDGTSYPALQFAFSGGRYVSGDFNGNGKPILVNISRPSSGSGVATPIVMYYQTGVDSDGSAIWVGGVASFDYYVADLNGDGKDDLIQVNRASGAALVAPGVGQNNDRVVSFSNGVEPPTVLTYRDLTDSTIYTPDNDGSAAIVDQRAPMLPASIAKKEGLQSKFYVVSSIAMPTDGANTMTTTYRYGGLKYDRDRRMLLGFRWMDSLQVEKGITTHSEFQQSWPYVGSLANSVTKLSTGQAISRVTNTFECMDFVSTAGCVSAIGRRYFPYVSQSTSSSWDLNGTALPVLTTATEYDSYGNRTKITSSTSDGYVKTVETTYSNDTTKWWIGKPTRTTTTSTTP
jgi:hypothetical protein